MKIENMPGCCTSAILYSFGEHGEHSVVTVDTIKEMVGEKAKPVVDLGGFIQDNAKRCIFAISVDPKNVRMLQKAGFKIRDTYEGIQGTVHIMTLHD